MGTNINRYPKSADVAHYEATRYASRDQRFISVREQGMIEGLLRGLEAPRGKVIDAPCGYGRFSPYLIERGWRVTNVDLAPAMVGKTVGATPQSSNGAAASLFADLPFRENSFDGALCVRMLHNTLSAENRTAVLRALGKVVSDWVVVTYYGNPVLHTAQFKLRRAMVKKARQTMAMISPRDFAAEAKAAGLTVEKDFAVLPMLHAQRIALLRKRPAR